MRPPCHRSETQPPNSEHRDLQSKAYPLMVTKAKQDISTTFEVVAVGMNLSHAVLADDNRSPGERRVIATSPDKLI